MDLKYFIFLLLLFHKENKIKEVFEHYGGYRMEYLTTSEAAEKWKISRRRVTVLCEEGRIMGVIQKGKIWLIPETASKPEDGRKKHNN